MTKLTNKGIKEMVTGIKRGFLTVKEAAKKYPVCLRRIQQLVKRYRRNLVVPKLNWSRRPRTFLSDEQKEVIEQVWGETRLTARLLYNEIKIRGHNVPKNKLHAYLKENGKAFSEEAKQGQRKRCRYEYTNSGDLLHGDWHESKCVPGKQVIGWIDDSSRRMLVLAEFDSASSENTLSTFKQAHQIAWQENVIVKRVNTDRGAQFYNNNGEPSGSQFQNLLKILQVQHIPSRVNHPQTNGKIERFWKEYEKHRSRFSDVQSFMNWYNNRLHGALKLEWAEKPIQAWQRKMPVESLLGLFFKTIG